MKFKFFKMHGLGNDFVVIETLTQSVALDAEACRQIADRHYGIGCDQVLFLMPPTQVDADFNFRIVNADGSEALQCGNGARCLGYLIKKLGLSDKKHVRLATPSHHVTLHIENPKNIGVEMGVPQFLSSHAVALKGQTREFQEVSLGNRHVVTRVDSCDDFPLQAWGEMLNNSPLFPDGVNMSAMEVVSEHVIKLRVFERGAQETLACGSGASGAAATAVREGWCKSPVRVLQRGGELTIEWALGEELLLWGPATYVFEGMFESKGVRSLERGASHG